MRDADPHSLADQCGIFVHAERGLALEVCHQPSDYVVVKCGVADSLQHLSVVDCVIYLPELYSLQHSTVWGFLFVESCCPFVS